MNLDTDQVSYKANPISSYGLFSLFILSNGFLFFVFYLVFTDGVEATNILSLTAFFIIWNSFCLYFLLNAPKKVVLIKNNLEIEWYFNRKKNYNLNNIDIMPIGLNPIPVIIIRDESWRLLGFSLQRILFIDGWSKKSKLFIAEMQNRKGKIRY